MASFSSSLTKLTGAGFLYEKDPRHATFNYSQDARSLYRNQPRVPFEFYIDIKLNNVGTAVPFIKDFFNNPTWTQVQPLVKTIDMPSFKIETTPLNQYNRKRISQTKLTFDPIKVVFHDVADGKTLKFWEMYYRYYFLDGYEPGKNGPKLNQQNNKPYTLETFLKNITPKLNPSIASLPSSVKSLFQTRTPKSNDLPISTNGDKRAIQNIVSDTFDNHNFGFNLLQVENVRNLIQSIDIYQVHGGRFNKVTLINPRISAFNHDTLSYAAGDKTLELTFTFEYEYAYYTIQNLKLGNNTQPNNDSSLEQFTHGEILELPALAFNATLMDFIESNNPLLQSDNPILQRIGKNVQTSMGSVTGAFLSDKVTRRASASALNGLANISPKPYNASGARPISSRPFNSTATPKSTMYKDVNRIGQTPGG